MDSAGLLLAVVITAASVQDRDAARPLLWNLHRVCRHIRLVWADAVYAGKLSIWAASLKMTLCIVAGVTRTPSRCCPAGGTMWSGRSPGSASTAAPSATTNASRPATKP